MKKPVVAIGGFLILISFLGISCQEHSELQITLSSDKDQYKIGEPIRLKYEVLWLGYNEARIYVNVLAFPRLEVLYLNTRPLNLQNALPIEVRSKPGRHEIRTFAPTMADTSDEFVINSPSEPIRFLNGVKGYYALEKHGSYVIRAKFDASSPWKVSDKQSGTIVSNTIVVWINK